MALSFYKFANAGNPSQTPPAGPTALTAQLDQNFDNCAFYDLSNAIFSAVATIAALRLFANAEASAAIVEGYAAPNDGGGGTFVYVSTDTTSADNGGTIIVDALARRWYRIVSGDYSALWFGIVGDGVTDNSAKVQALVNAAAGNPIFFPVGQFCFHGITSSTPVNIRGAGNGAGPGPGAQSNANDTQFFINSSTSDLFTITSEFPSIFSDFQVNVLPANRPMTAGVGIHLIGTGTANVANYLIQNVGFTNVYTPIYVLRPDWGVITGCYFDTWYNSAIYLTTSAGIESAGGQITHNYFFGFSSTATPAIFSQVGYTVIDDNEILGGNYGIEFSYANNAAGFTKITNNTIENFGSAGILIQTADGSLASMVMIQNNELSDNSNQPTAGIIIQQYTATPGWITDVLIQGNISRTETAANGKHIWVMAGQNVIISENLIDELGTNTGITGILLTGVSTNAGLVAPIQVLDNSFMFTGGGSITHYGFTAGVVTLRDLVGLPYASLPSVAKGSMVYVTDGTCTSSTNAVVTSGGSGCTASYVRSNWYSQQYGLTG